MILILQKFLLLNRFAISKWPPSRVKSGAEFRRQLRRHRKRAAIRGVEARRERVVTEIRKARLTGIRVAVRCRSWSSTRGPWRWRGSSEFFAARTPTGARARRTGGPWVSFWPDARPGASRQAVSPLHVVAYIRTHPGSAPTVKQHLAAIRMLGDWLVVSQVLPVNPAAAVRGPKHVVTKGATLVLSPAEARRLLEAIDAETLAGLCDRALVSVMLYSFGRVSAVIGMRR